MANKMLNLLSGGSNDDMSVLMMSEEYRKFRSCVSLKKMIVDDDSSKEWTLYDCGPRSIVSPLIFLPPVSGTADIFYRQMLFLSSKGYRIIAVQYPTYWTLREFINGFLKLLDHMMLDRVHIFGASLGGFLAQKFAESTSVSPRVASLILCNSFADTSIFNHTESAPMFWLMPATVLKKLVMGGNSLHAYSKDESIVNAIEFMSQQLNKLSQTELASRLMLNCINSYVEPQLLHSLYITIIDVFDYCALSQTVREELYKLYPEAKRAHLKTGGNFPYLSRSDEVNMHLIIHLRNFRNTKYSACVEDIEIASTATSDINNET